MREHTIWIVTFMRFMIGKTKSGGWICSLYTPLFGASIQSKYWASNRDGYESRVWCGLWPKIWAEEGDFLYRFNFERSWEFIPVTSEVTWEH